MKHCFQGIIHLLQVKSFPQHSYDNTAHTTSHTCRWLAFPSWQCLTLCVENSWGWNTTCVTLIWNSISTATLVPWADSLDLSPIAVVEENREKNADTESGMHRKCIYTRRVSCCLQMWRTHTQSFDSVLSSVRSAADRRAHSDTNHQAEEVLSPNLSFWSSIPPPVCHLERRCEYSSRCHLPRSVLNTSR